jgi:two-component system, chemotaxis family, protein-glutamate methylesterase/glutaminase
MDALRETVIGKVRLAAVASGSRQPKSDQKRADTNLSRQALVVAIGASTGGVAALNTILPALRIDAPPVLITQHMPPVFTQQLANRLNKQCAITVKEAVDGEPLSKGHAYIAPGDKHLTVRRTRNGLECATAKGDLVNGHMPSVDVLFESVAKTVGAKAIGILLTGMGRDGAQGLLQMREAGAATFTQDEATSLVFGMPNAAMQLGASQAELSLSEIPQLIADAGMRKASSLELTR